MKKTRVTTAYLHGLMRIAFVAMVLLLGPDVVTATQQHDSEVDSGIHAAHALTVEQCTLADGSAPFAGPVPTPHYAVMIGVGTVIHFDPDLRITLASAAPALDASLLRLFYQVFLN